MSQVFARRVNIESSSGSLVDGGGEVWGMGGGVGVGGAVRSVLAESGAAMLSDVVVFGMCPSVAWDQVGVGKPRDGALYVREVRLGR